MPALCFTRNESPTVGVELELQLVDARHLGLVSAIEPILERLPEELRANVKPEIMQCYLEINSQVCRNIDEVRADLTRILGGLKEVTDGLGIRLFWSATHPFSSWRRQQITVNDRYYRLVELMQDITRRLVTFGLHVHVGVDSGDKAVMICDRMLQHLPLLLALSANSPFWEGRPSGLHSNRSKIMEMLPTAGLPSAMRNWSEYTWIVNHLIDTGFIHSIRELWWDIRPHHNFGTVEIRMCDMPRNLDHALALAALIQTLVVRISQQIDEGTWRSESHPMMVAQNKWRAARYGGKALLVDAERLQPRPVQEIVDRMVDQLLPTAESLGCAADLERCRELPAQTGAQQQLEIYGRTHSRHKLVEEMLAQNEWRPA